MPNTDYSDYGNNTVPGVIPDLNLSSTDYSLLGPMYTIGLVLGSFLFAALAHLVNAMRLLGWGTVIWAIGEHMGGRGNRYIQSLGAPDGQSVGSSRARK